MPTNYIRLLNCNKNEMEMFIRSIVSKEASSYVDWHAWMSSENPEVTYIGKPANYKDENGESHPCRVLKETEEDGKVIRHVFIVKAKGKVERLQLPKENVIIRGEEDTKTEISDAEIDDILAAMTAAVDAEKKEEEEAALEIADAIAAEIAASEAVDTITDEDEVTEEDLDASLAALKKRRFTDYDPDDPEDAELPTIAFTAMTGDEY